MTQRASSGVLSMTGSATDTNNSKTTHVCIIRKGVWWKMNELHDGVCMKREDQARTDMEKKLE